MGFRRRSRRNAVCVFTNIFRALGYADSMGTSALLTIDTELTWRHHRPGESWETNYALSVEPARVGLSYQLAKLRSFGLKACFFVDPMPAAVFGLEVVERMVKTVLDAGQEVQLHLHPMWADTDRNGLTSESPAFELIDHDRERQRDLIAQARDWLVEAGAPDPIAFRSGSYAANDDTLRALHELGFRYDSSHNGCEAPWPSAIDLPIEQIAPIEREGVTVIPVTQLAIPGGSVRHVQICAVSLAEMRAAIDHAQANALPVITMVGHSFELATRDGQRPNRIVKRRFDRLCALLAERADSVPTQHFADLESMQDELRAEPVAVSPLAVAGRVVEQAAANVLERVAL